MPLTAGSSSRLFAMISAYIHEPSPFCRRSSSGRNWPGRRVRALPQLDDPIAVVGVHGVEDALALGPRRRPCSRRPARWSGSCTAASPSASMTEITSEMFATSAAAVAPPTRARVFSASTRSVTSRALVTTPSTAGSSLWLVATISIQRSSPSARAEAVAHRLRRSRAARAGARTAAATTGRSSSKSPKSTGIVGIRLRVDAEEPPRARAAVRDLAVGADDRDHVARVLHERAEPHLALPQRELGALLVAHVGDHHHRRDDAPGGVAQRCDRDVDVERPAVAAARTAPRASARSRRRTPARSARGAPRPTRRTAGGEPIASAAVHPNSSSHAWFHTCTVPAASTAKIGSGDDCTIERSAASLRRRAASVARRSVMSRDNAEKYS